MHLTGTSALLALLMLCGILFVEECGVPLPILPGDGLLVAGGILVGSGRLSPLLFVPAATLAMCAGALIGHAWSDAVGRPILARLAGRSRAPARLERGRERLLAAGAWGVLVCRLIPGLRVYTNLAAGAAGMRRRPFLAGVVPSVLAWVAGFGALGILVGRPVEHALFATRGRLLLLTALLAMGAAAVLLARHLPPRRDRASAHATSLGRVCAALALDIGLAAVIVSAVAELVEEMLRIGDAREAGMIAVMLPIGSLVYIAASRRTRGRTAGEGLLGISYRDRRAH